MQLNPFKTGKSFINGILIQAPNSEQKRSATRTENEQLNEIAEILSQASHSEIVSKKRARRTIEGNHRLFRQWCEDGVQGYQRPKLVKKRKTVEDTPTQSKTKELDNEQKSDIAEASEATEPTEKPASSKIFNIVEERKQIIKDGDSDAEKFNEAQQRMSTPQPKSQASVVDFDIDEKVNATENLKQLTKPRRKRKTVESPEKDQSNETGRPTQEIT